VTAEREDPSSGTADIAKQQLQNRRRSDDLHAHRMLRPADGVADSRGSVGAGRSAEDLRDVEERVTRNAAHVLDHLGRIACVVTLQNLKHAARMFQGRISGRRRVLRGLAAAILSMASTLAFVRDVLVLGRRTFVRPAIWRVAMGSRIPAGEESVQILGVAKVLRNDRCRVRVGDNVIAKLEAVHQHVIDERAEERDVGASANGYPPIRHR